MDKPRKKLKAWQGAMDLCMIPLEALGRNLRNFTTLPALRLANWILKLKLQND